MVESVVNNEVDLDAILVELKEFGKFQIINYAHLAIVALLVSSAYLSYIFTAGQLTYRQVECTQCSKDKSV